MARAPLIPIVASSPPMTTTVTLPPCFSVRRSASSTAFAAWGSSSWLTSFRTIRLVAGSSCGVTELSGTTFAQTTTFTRRASGARLSGEPLRDVAFEHDLQNFLAVVERLVHELRVVLEVRHRPVDGRVEGQHHLLHVLVEGLGVRRLGHGLAPRSHELAADVRIRHAQPHRLAEGVDLPDGLLPCRR